MFGICVNNCDCTYYVKKNLTKNFTLCKGQLVNLHSYNTDNVELSLFGGDKTKLTSPNHLYFHVINDKLFACLNAISSLNNRIKFYNNKENRDFVLNLNGPTTVSVTVLNQQLKGLFQEQTNVKGKTFFTLELLEEPSKQLISVIKEYGHKYIAGKYQLTVAANMIQLMNLPAVTIDHKIEESLNFELDKKQKWCCSMCHQENWFKSKKCRKCDSVKTDGVSFPGADNYLSGKYHPQTHRDHSVVIEAFSPNESQDRSFVDCYNIGSTGINKNDNPPLNRLQNQNQSNDNVNGILSRTMGACKPEIVQNKIKSRIHKIEQLRQIYKKITDEKPSTLKQKKPDDFKIPNQFVEAAKNKCLTTNEVGNNCSKCDEKHDDIPLDPTNIRCDVNLTDYDQSQCNMAPDKDFTISSRTSCNVPSTILRKLANINVCDDSSKESSLSGITPESSNEISATDDTMNRSDFIESLDSDSETEITNASRQKQRIDHPLLISFEENFSSSSSRNDAIPLDSNFIVPGLSNLSDCMDNSNPYEIDKQESHHTGINDNNGDLMDNFMIAVDRNTIKADCLSYIQPLDFAKGFVLQLCNHIFCEPCSKGRITTYIIDYELEKLTCRARVNGKLCGRKFELCEIKYFLPDHLYQQFSIRLIDAKITNSFIKMCYDKNCSGYYLCEKYHETRPDDFVCNKCKLKNCLQCEVIHDGINCTQYRKLIGVDESIDKDTIDLLLNWIREGIAIRARSVM